MNQVSRPTELSPLQLIETIRALAAAGSTGALSVRRGSEERTIYFQDGLIKTVASTQPQEDPLERALLESRSFAQEEIDDARRAAVAGGKSLAQVLLERGAARGMDASRLLDCRSMQETARMMSWERMECLFSEGTHPPAFPDHYAARLSGGVDAEEIAEVLRRAATRRR